MPINDCWPTIKTGRCVYNTWLHQSFSGKLKFRKLENNLYELDDSDRKPIADFSVYVNVRNECRFFRATPIKDAQREGDRDNAILSTVRLRQQKALHLYLSRFPSRGMRLPSIPLGFAAYLNVASLKN